MAKIVEYQTGYAQVGVVTSIGRGQIVPWASVGNAPEQEAATGRKIISGLFAAIGRMLR